jgi:hypothetical protein
MRSLYAFTRDVHLYAGLFLCPFVVMYAVSVVFLVHAWVPGGGRASTRTVSHLVLPPNMEELSGRERVGALRPALASMGVTGEVGFVQYQPKRHRLILPLSVPGRETWVTLDVAAGSAEVEERRTGPWDALVTLHKMPGPHLTGTRGNAWWVRAWRPLADAAAYGLLLLTLTGIWLWWAIRGARKAGGALVVAGAIFFLGVVYALARG